MPADRSTVMAERAYRTLPPVLIEDGVEECIVKGQTVDGGSYSGTRFRNVTFRNCRFTRTSFARCEFSRVTFEGCDLSGSDLTESYWDHSRWEEGKGVGIRMSDAYFADTVLEDCNLRYADLSRGKWKGGALCRCDLQEGFFSECKLTRFTLSGCDLTRTEVMRTPLAGLDLSDSTIDDIRCSDTLAELRGALIDPMQAVEIAGRIGIKIK